MKYLVIMLIMLSPNAAYGKGHDRAKIIDAIVKAADLAKVPRALVLAVCWHEGGSTKARGKNPTHMDGATLSHGICQVKLDTARDMDKTFKHRTKATEKRLQDDFVSAFYAAKYLKVKLREYNDDWRLAIDAYNKGTAHGHNTEYVRRVMVAMSQFQ